LAIFLLIFFFISSPHVFFFFFSISGKNCWRGLPPQISRQPDFFFLATILRPVFPRSANSSVAFVVYLFSLRTVGLPLFFLGVPPHLFGRACFFPLSGLQSLSPPFGGPVVTLVPVAGFNGFFSLPLSLLSPSCVSLFYLNKLWMTIVLLGVWPRLFFFLLSSSYYPVQIFFVVQGSCNFFSPFLPLGATCPACCSTHYS